MAEIQTLQSNIRTHTADVSKYALFLGGTNVVRDALAQYDPLITGYARIFMVRKPVFLINNIPSKLQKFKHILEYGNTSVQGLGDVTVNTGQIQGGYNGKSFEIPTYADDSTNRISIQVYEFSGSPIREVVHTWINGTVDLLGGLTHYNGEAHKWAENDAEGVAPLQANQTAEFIYCVTDRTGEKVEYACLLANCFPLGIDIDPFNYTSGSHDPVQTTIDFTATKYESLQINKVATELLRRYKVLTNSVNFNSGLTDSELGNGLHYDENTGYLQDGVIAGNPGVPRTDMASV